MMQTRMVSPPFSSIARIRSCPYLLLAEDYYTADYPDDEVESDDEYGRDPYHYRTGNASDLEEFDGDGVAGSDDEGSPTKAGVIESLRSQVFGIDRSRG